MKQNLKQHTFGGIDAHTANSKFEIRLGFARYGPFINPPSPDLKDDRVKNVILNIIKGQKMKY